MVILLRIIKKENMCLLFLTLTNQTFGHLFATKQLYVMNLLYELMNAYIYIYIFFFYVHIECEQHIFVLYIHLVFLYECILNPFLLH